MVNRGSAAITVPSAFSKMRFWRNTARRVARNRAVDDARQPDDRLRMGRRPRQRVAAGRPDATIAHHSRSAELFVDFGNVVGPATATHALTLVPALERRAGVRRRNDPVGLGTRHAPRYEPGHRTLDGRHQHAAGHDQCAWRHGCTARVTAGRDVSGDAQHGHRGAGVDHPVTRPNGASLPAESQVTITGTAVDSGGRCDQRRGSLLRRRHQVATARLVARPGASPGGLACSGR